MTVLALCNNSNNKKKKISKEKATLKDNKPKPAEVKTAEKPKQQQQQTPDVTALSNTKPGSDEVVETKTAIAGDSPKDFRTVQEEDSFDRLQPRQIYANRYKEVACFSFPPFYSPQIADAPKVNRKDAKYDTLKMFANGGGFSQQMSVQN